LIKFIETFDEENMKIFVIELMEGSLKYQIESRKKENKYFEENEIMNILIQIL
jgi:hypothetical protein